MVADSAATYCCTFSKPTLHRCGIFFGPDRHLLPNTAMVADCRYVCMCGCPNRQLRGDSPCCHMLHVSTHANVFVHHSLMTFRQVPSKHLQHHRQSADVGDSGHAWHIVRHGSLHSHWTYEAVGPKNAACVLSIGLCWTQCRLPQSGVVDVAVICRFLLSYNGSCCNARVWALQCHHVHSIL